MSIGDVYYKSAEYANALENYLECLKIKRQTLPKEHVSIASTLNSIGFVYEKMNDYEKALEHFKESHEIYEKLLPSNHNTLKNTLKIIEKIKLKIEN